MEYIILIISLAGIVFGADYLVNGAVSIARRYKVSDFVIGAAIVGIGTSMPELVVSFIGALNGNADVAIGNVVGSNIFNTLGILGLTAIFFPIIVDKANMKFEIPFCLGISTLLILLSFNFFNGEASVISRFDGWLLLVFFAFYMWYSFYRDSRTGASCTNETADEIKAETLWLSIVKITGGLAVLIISCDFFIDNAVLIARSFGVNDAFISLTMIACGTSLPELAASLAAAMKKNTQMALGNVIGSNIFNITLILGLSSQVTPLRSSGITAIDYFVVTAAIILVMILGRKVKIGRVSGAVLFLSFIAYNWYLFSMQ